MTGILNVVGYIAYGGIESLIFNFSDNIDHSEIKYDLISSNAGMPEMQKKIESTGLNIYYIARRRRHLFKHIFQMFKILKDKRDDYQILHVHMINDSYIPLFLGWLCGYKIRIAHSHTSYMHSNVNLYIKITRWLTCIFATHGVGCSATACDFLFKNSHLPLKIIPNCITYENYLYNSKQRNKYRKQLGINEKKSLVVVGRLEKEKNHKFLCELMADNKLNDCLLFIIGEGSERNQLEYLIEQKGLKSKIKLLGKRGNVNLLLNAFDGFVLPSLHEGFPIVLLEAQINGLYCIVSDNITTEVDISNRISFLSLNKEKWINEINNIPSRLKVNFDGEDMYDAKNSTKKLLSYYDQLLEEAK